MERSNKPIKNPYAKSKKVMTNPYAKSKTHCEFEPSTFVAESEQFAKKVTAALSASPKPGDDNTTAHLKMLYADTPANDKPPSPAYLPVTELTYTQLDIVDEQETVAEEEQEPAPAQLNFAVVEGSKVPAKLPGMNKGDANQAVLGKAKSTQSGKVSAVAFLNMILAEFEHIPRFEELTYEHVAGENLQLLLHQICATVATVPIPQRCKDGLLPADSKNKKIIKWSTAQQYLGRIFTLFRGKFDKHEQFPSKVGDNPVWWDQMVTDTENEFKRNYNNKWSKDPDIEFGTYKVQPLYSVLPQFQNEEETAEFLEWFYGESEPSSGRSLGSYHRFHTDLLHIMSNRFDQIDPFFPHTIAEPTRDLFSWQLVSRGGEVGNCVWSEAKHFPLWSGIGIMKHQQKVLSRGHLIMVVPHLEFYQLCPFFWLGIYFFMGEGQARTQQQMDNGSGAAIFPDEWHRSSSAVSDRIGKSLKKGLDPKASKELKDSICQRSLRQGGINEISMHQRGRDPMTITGRSSHKTGINIDAYEDHNNPVRSLLGGQILSGHKCFSRPVRLPAPWWMDSDLRPEFLKLHRYFHRQCDIPAFQEGGKLFEFYSFLLCHVIMYVNVIAHRSRGHPVVVFFEGVAKDVGLSFGDGVHPSMVLTIMGQQLRERFKAENHSWDDNRMERVQDRVDECFEAMGKMARKQAESERRMENLVREMTTSFQQFRKGMESDINRSRSVHRLDEEKLQEMKYQLDSLRAKTSFLKSPPSDSRKRAAVPDPAATAQAKAPPQSSSMTVVNNSGQVFFGGSTVNGNSSSQARFGAMQAFAPAAQAQEPEEEATQPPAKKKKYANKSEELDAALYDNRWDRRTCDKGKITLDALCKQLHKEGWYNNNGKPSVPFNDESRAVHKTCKTYPAYFRYCMEVLEGVLSPEQRSTLCNSLGQAHLYNTKDMLEFYKFCRDATLQAVLTKEGRGSEIDLPEEVRRRQVGAKPKASVTGLGQRIREVKKKIAKLCPHVAREGKRGLNLTPFWTDVDANRTDQPPRGHQAIDTYFPANGRHTERPNRRGQAQASGSDPIEVLDDEEDSHAVI